MKHFCALAIAACAALLLPACTDYATFVTSTDIGISADVNTQDLHIGYVRTELFTGPGYPEVGAAPAAIGYLGSNLSAFTPKIKQLYATGQAAEIVTRGTQPVPNPDPTATPVELAGPRRPLVFGTGSNLGLQVGFAGGTPSKVKFGYNREELSIIPLRQQTPASDQKDKYAPVLASIDMNQSLTNLADSEVKLKQFFSTGEAAKNLARRDDIKHIFEDQAKEAVRSAASLSGTYSFDDDSSGKLVRFWGFDGKNPESVNKNSDAKIKSCMRQYNLTGTVAYLIYARPKAEKEIVISCLHI